jgi:hypothetical protein
MFIELATLQFLMKKYQESDPWCLLELVALASSDEAEFWRRFNTNEIWGGAGSLADQFLSSAQSTNTAELHDDQVAFRKAMVSLAAIMRAKGMNNSRADDWAKTFELWNALGL